MNTIWAYIDGTLEPKEREAFERELAVSEKLRSEVESARMLMASLANEPLAETNNHFGHNVLVELSQQATLAQKPKRGYVRYLIPSVIAVAAVLVVAIILMPSDDGSSSTLFSVRQFSNPLIEFFTTGVSSMIIVLITCGYILVWLDKVLRRRLLGK